jgi:hypothetical protein
LFVSLSLQSAVLKDNTSNVVGTRRLGDIFRYKGTGGAEKCSTRVAGKVATAIPLPI